nr:15515_t:CDS:2 [Entrophospora candida]
MNGSSKSSYGNCDTCDQPQTDNGWCSVCQTKIFQENFINWTSAIWIDGPIIWDGVKLNRKSNCKIALKNLDTSSESLSDEFLNESLDINGIPLPSILINL